MKPSITEIDFDKIDDESIKQICFLIRTNYGEGYGLDLTNNPTTSLERKLKEHDTEIYKRRIWVARTDRIIGYAQYSIPKIDNKHIASCHIYVLKEFRNQGLGKQLLREFSNNIMEEANIIQLYTETKDIQLPSSIDQYLIEKGMKLKFTHRNSSSNLTGFNTLEVEKIVNELKEKSHKKGYSVIFVKNGNYEDISEITFDAFAKMRQDIWNDMPREDGTWEDEIYDKDVHQGIYKQVEFGYESWMFLAIHEETGDIAGITETWFNPDLPQFAFQDDTGVVKQHRGNGLGLMLKYLMLSKMLSHDRRKDLVYWTTGNADSNEHMLKINDVLKYKPEYYELIYEISRDEFSNLLS